MGDYMRTGSSPLPRRGHKRHRRRKIDPGILTRQGMATKNTRNTKTDKAEAEKMKLGKVENRETEIRIDQYIFDHGWGQDGIRMDLRHSSFGFNPDRIRGIRG